MKFAVKLSILTFALVFVLGVYTVTARADVPAVEAPQELGVEKSEAQSTETTPIQVPQELPLQKVAEPAPPQPEHVVQKVPAVPKAEVRAEPPPAPKAIPGVPVHVSIPAAKINAPVIRVGTNAVGEMDVPDGATNNVGWYERGTKPGNKGTAVLDAHVYAALKNLHLAKAGDDIYVDTEGGGRLHFRVEEAVYYTLADVPRQLLFNRADQPRLNLITCAGTYDSSRDTYTHRLIVYAVLVD